jgi:2-amino-4-hydroxy-6-hydroxymethyldihydropteridine diphosphokinase
MSDAPVMACVAVGANLGDAVATVQQALRDLGALPQSQQVRVSSLYRSAPYEALGPDFINAVALLSTHLAPLALLHALQDLEQQSGRERPYKNAPRTLDLDLIFYGDVVMTSAELTLPHPRWHERAFVLHPLAEIWPQRVSVSQWTAVEGQVIQRMAV